MTRSRSRTFGSVRKLPSGRYQASYWQDGVRHSAPGTFAAKADANAYLSSVEADVRRGAWIDPRRAQTQVTQLAAQWKTSNPAKRASSLDRDETVLRLHVLPAIGARRIGSVTPIDVQALVNRWVEEGHAPNTVRRHYDVVRAIFNYAVAADWLVRTPCRNVKLPSSEPRQRRQLTASEVAQLADGVGPEYAAMIYVAAVLGLRWGEVAGLRVARLDLLRGTLAVTEQVTRGARGRSEIGPPKSAAARRTMTMPNCLVDLVAEHLPRRDLTAAHPDAFVFVGRDGLPLDYNNWRGRVWLPGCRRAGLDGVGFHDLRRAAATALVAGGVDVKTAQVRLGHSDSRLTLDVYAQATNAGDRAAAKIVGDHFFAHESRTPPSADLKGNQESGG